MLFFVVKNICRCIFFYRTGHWMYRRNSSGPNCGCCRSAKFCVPTISSQYIALSSQQADGQVLFWKQRHSQTHRKSSCSRHFLSLTAIGNKIDDYSSVLVTKIHIVIVCLVPHYRKKGHEGRHTTLPLYKCVH